MPTKIFDWMARTAMLAMAGLVTLSILGAIAAMTADPGTRFSVPRDRPAIEGEREQEPRAAQAPPAAPQDGNSASSGATAPSPDRSQGVVIAQAPAPPEDKATRWLEAIAYALMALVGIGILGILMLWSMVRELRRVGRMPH